MRFLYYLHNKRLWVVTLYNSYILLENVLEIENKLNTVWNYDITFKKYSLYLRNNLII